MLREGRGETRSITRIVALHSHTPPHDRTPIALNLSGLAFLPLFGLIIFLLILLASPLPGRGPKSTRRDSWRSFKFSIRREVMLRAGGRCEAAILVAWGRCRNPATDADHIYPWPKGGPTILSNGQVLCRSHNTSKGARTPPWWMVLGLERRRKNYFPPGASLRVSAGRSPEDRTANLQT